jgi:hypothetical protein
VTRLYAEHLHCEHDGKNDPESGDASLLARG